MREILFRGFHPCENGTKTISIDGKEHKGEWIDGYFFKIWHEYYILWGTTNGIPNMLEVLSETVGQYTNLTDKNGAKIFGGDIIRWGRDIEPYERIAVVEINPDIRFRLINGDKSIFRYGCFAYQDTHKYLEVIATIFDKEGENERD